MSVASDPARNIVVLISGSGTNLQALIDGCQSSRIPNARISLVFSNKKAAYGLIRASSSDPPIHTDYLALQPYLRTAPETRTRIDYDLEVARRLITKSQDPIDIIVLAGFMHILSAEFLSVFTGDREYAEGKKLGKPVPIINLHPALPGAFDGADALPRAWDAFQQGKMGDNPKTGAMVHQVVPEVDRGEPIVVREVEMKEMNSLEELEEKIHAVEHEIIVEAVIKLLA